MERDSQRLERIFAACFEADYHTVLEGGGEEPLYLPSDAPLIRPHRIVYREDYFASALHEVAHWCLAGPSRRLLEDYGYWYAPDGRDESAQLAFEAAEARPQALEWIYSEACGFEFHLSADNLAAGFGPSDRFAKTVETARRVFQGGAMPARARLFEGALRSAFACGADSVAHGAADRR